MYIYLNFAASTEIASNPSGWVLIYVEYVRILAGKDFHCVFFCYQNVDELACVGDACIPDTPPSAQKHFAKGKAKSKRISLIFCRLHLVIS